MLKSLFKKSHTENNQDTKISDYWFVLLLICFVLIAAIPLMNNKLIVTHETISPIIRISELYKNVGNGQIFVRWMPDLSRGYGYPLFNFYSPLFYYVAFFFSTMNFGAISAFNLSSILMWILSGVGMYIFCREFFGKYGALVCATAYIYAPYHLVDLYVRGAAAEFTSLALFPFILWAFYKFNSSKKQIYISASAVLIAGLVLSHNVMTLFFLPVVAAYILFLYAVSEKKDLKNLFHCFISLILGISLSAFFLLPAFLEKNSVNISSMTEGYYNYNNHFVYFDQLLKTNWGYGASMPGKEDKMSYAIGLVHILLSTITLFALKKIYKINYKTALHIGFFAIVAFFSIYLMMPESKYIWDMLSLLQFAQFPWRFLAITIFAVSFICGGVLSLITKKQIKIWATALCLVTIIFSNISYSKPQLYYKNIPNDKVVAKNIVNDPSVSSFAHFLSDYTPSSVKNSPVSDPKEILSTISGNAEIKYKKQNSVEYNIEIGAKENSIFTFNQFYFPIWKISENNKPIVIKSITDNGLPEFELNEGVHNISIKLGNTKLRSVSTLISYISLSIILAILFYSVNKIWQNKKISKKQKILLSALFGVAISLSLFGLFSTLRNIKTGKTYTSNIGGNELINYAETEAPDADTTSKITLNEDGDYKYYFDLGTQYGAKKEHIKAVEAFEKSITLNPKFVNAYLNLAVAYVSTNNFVKAVETYEKIIQLGEAEKNSIIYLNLGALYANNIKDYQKAAEYLQKYIDLNPTIDNINNLLTQIKMLKTMSEN